MEFLAYKRSPSSSSAAVHSDRSNDSREGIAAFASASEKKEIIRSRNASTNSLGNYFGSSNSSSASISQSSPSSSENKFLPNFFLSKRSEPKKPFSSSQLGSSSRYSSAKYTTPSTSTSNEASNLQSRDFFFGNASYEDLVPKQSLLLEGQQSEEVSFPDLSNFPISTLNENEQFFNLGNRSNTSTTASLRLNSCSQENLAISKVSSSQNTLNWVTVFGFPCELKSEIVEFFSHLGHIIEQQEVSSPQSCQLSFRFSTPWEAQRALKNNGMLFQDKYMIGVIGSNSEKLQMQKKNFSSLNDNNNCEREQDFVKVCTLGISQPPSVGQYSSPAVSASLFGVAAAGAASTIPSFNGTREHFMENESSSNAFQFPSPSSSSNILRTAFISTEGSEQLEKYKIANAFNTGKDEEANAFESTLHSEETKPVLLKQVQKQNYNVLDLDEDVILMGKPSFFERLVGFFTA